MQCIATFITGVMLFIGIDLIFEFHEYKAGFLGISSAILFAICVMAEFAKAKR